MAQNGGILKLLGRLAFPARCAACHTLLDWYEDGDTVFCAACERQWVSETLERCGICGERVTDCVCMPQAMQKAKCECLYKLVYYAPRLRDAAQNRLVYRLKNGSARREAVFAAERMRPQLECYLRTHNVTADEVIVTYLPRSARTRLQTGSDQARELSRALAKRCGLEMRPLITRRAWANRAQKTLSPEGRMKNAKRAYVARKRATCAGKTVVLVDDIVTTGAGMAVASRILRRMGARRVICMCVATDVVNKDLP